MEKRALITGVTGQMGSYLAEFLLEEGYEVYGLIRRGSTTTTYRVNHLLCNQRFHLVDGDLTDQGSLNRVVQMVSPDICINMAANSFVGSSWQLPLQVGEVTGLGVMRVVESLRGHAPNCRLVQASTSELYGKVQEIPQKETTPFYPRSPYGIAKLYGYWSVVNARESYGMHASNIIMFNSESPRRGFEFVTRKITYAVAQFKYRVRQEPLLLGNLDAKRDWSHARDTIKGFYLASQQPTPDDYVLASGETHTVREFLELAFAAADIPIKSNGRVGVEEKFIRTDTGEVVVEISREFFRPAEVDLLLGDSTKARTVLGWKPEITFKQLIEDMVTNDLNLVQKENVE